MKMMDRLEGIARRIDVRYRLIVMFTLILAGVTGFMGIYATSEVSKHLESAASEKLLSDLRMGEQIINEAYPGSWQIKNGQLYKGQVMIEGRYEVIDQIGNLTGDTVTVFRGDTRVSTNVTKEGKRQINTQVSDKVKQEVLEKGQLYLGQAEVVGSTYFAAYQPIKDSNNSIIGIWYVGVPTATYDELVSGFRNSMLGYSAAGIGIGFLAAFLIAYTVYVPLRRIRVSLKSIGEGDLTHKVEARAGDEIGRLAGSVNIMVDRISDLISKAKLLTVGVSQASQELADRSDTTAVLMEGMAVQANELSQSADYQAEMTGQSRQVINEMSVVIQRVAENAQEVSSSVITATDQAQEGEKQIDSAIHQIATVSDTVNSTAVIVSGLGAKSLEIGQIVDLITNIADQTNLLALNAAIEAARAGEQGRGFAVVAEEVRKLAEESGDAAKRIAGLIAEIQTEADRAVHAMEKGTREVATGTSVVADAGKAFQQIINAVNQVNMQIQEMSAASQEMAASAETAMQAIEATNAAAVRNAEGAQNISQIAGEQKAGVDEMNASIDRLTSVITDLETAVSFFKIQDHE